VALWLNGVMPRTATGTKQSLVFDAKGFRLIEFNRKPIDPDPIRGFALAWNKDLTLIHVLESNRFRLNGYAIFRNEDVRKWRAFPPDDFLSRSARILRLAPSKPDGVAFSSMRQAIASAGASFPLVTVHRERIHRGGCDIGKVLRTNQRTLTILPITPQAEWEEAESFHLKDITLIEFGGAYEDLLFRLANKPGLGVPVHLPRNQKH